MGQIVLDWQLGGFAADSSASAASMADPSQTSQLVQAMAGFGGGSGGAVESFDTVGLGSDPSQQSLLTTPQHG
jgi:hypothetical protein